jgi:hypothetical protein
MKDQLAKTQAPERTEQIPAEPDPRAPAVGRWFWVKNEERTGVPSRWFGCVMHVGSNYAELHAPDGSYERIHEDEFYDRCEPEPEAKAVIAKHVAEHETKVHALMAEVKAITARLGVPLGHALPAAGEARALAVRGAGGADMGAYKSALTLAKDKTLPGLFEQIRQENESLRKWLTAELLPLKAQHEAMEPAIEAIKDRIFSVELYAGLVEEVKEVAGGRPAPRETPIHLMQRRCYCDEECLARYEAGGMEFKDLGAFDDWLARPENRDRILPFERCVVAFQVRRREKDREWSNLFDFFKMLEDRELDKLTFLYIKNGEQLYRLSTEIEFDEKLFPDMDAPLLRGGKKLYAKIWGSERVEKLISEDEYDAMVREEEEAKRELARKRAAAAKKDKWQFRDWTFRETEHYHPFTRESVHYDDIATFVQSEMKKHNRLVLVLQGLLDRSPALHPHPPWSVWTDEGFRDALRLVYDDSRALAAGDKPDFEAYRKRCNEKLAPGAACVGQEDYWERREADKENLRLDRDWRHKRGDYRPTHHRPYGNPGPGKIARASKASKHGATFEWDRERIKQDDTGEPIRCSLAIPKSALLCVDGYKLGDYRIFFEDPRTRAEYLKWAPLLLVAEDFHAGKRECPEAPAPRPKRRTSRGAFLYRQRKTRLALVGKAVRLRRDITMQSGKVHPKGSLWRVSSNRGERFALSGLGEDGKELNGAFRVFISDAHERDFEVDENIPLEPSEET